MKEIGGSLSTGEVFAEIAALLDRHDADRGAVDAATWLEWVCLARRVRQRVEAATDLLLAEAEKVQASERAKGTPLAAWLGTQAPISRREAKSAIYRARKLADHPAVGEAAATGRIGLGQARAIGGVLDGLGRLDPAQQHRAEALLLELSDHLDADQLAKATPQVLAAVAPADADEFLETKLQREAEAAHNQRSLRFWREAGSIRFDGSLPKLEGEQFITLIDAHTEKLRRDAITARDRLAVRPTPEQRRADALASLLRTAASGAAEPGLGTARVIVKLDYQRLKDAAAGAGLIGPDDPISAGDLRRICCDAEIIPAVLNGPSEVLDVGRARRLVTPAIRTALILRDGGCTFPGCNAPPHLCEAHHIIPWQQGGPTSLGNLTLVCHTDHGVGEPARHRTRDQWQIRIAPDGLPEYLPPVRVDPDRTPVRHSRFTAPEPRTTEPASVTTEPQRDLGVDTG